MQVHWRTHSETAQLRHFSGLNLAGHTDLSQVAQLWREFEPHCLATFYQSYAWCSAYADTLGKLHRRSPLIIVAKFSNDEVAFILPFQISKICGLRSVEWLAQDQNSYSCGIFSNRFLSELGDVWMEANFFKLLEEIIGYDILNLRNMAQNIDAASNPLKFLNNFKAANCSYKLAILDDYQKLLRRKRSSKSIGKMQRRDERIFEMRDTKIEVGGGSVDVLKRLFDFKTVQLAQMGVHGVFDTASQNFFYRLMQNCDRGSAALRVFALTTGNEPLGYVLGGIFNSQFYLMVTTLGPKAPLPLSPGDMLLRHSIEWACQQKVQSYDFSTGDEGYKSLWADEAVPLFNHFAARRVLALPFVAGMALGQWMKRMVKQNTFAKVIYLTLRRRLRGRSA